MSASQSLFSDEEDFNENVDSGEEWQDTGESDNNPESSDSSPVPTDVESDEDDPVSDNEPDNSQLNWQETYEELDIDPFIENTGPSHNLGPNSSELDFFKLFFDDTMLDKIVEETNRYASQNGPDRHWQDTTREEISAFIGT